MLTWPKRQKGWRFLTEEASLCCGNGAQSQLVQCWRGAQREKASSSTEPMSCPLADQNKPEKSQVSYWASRSWAVPKMAWLVLCSCSVINDGGFSEAAPGCSSKVLEQENAFVFLRVWHQALICMVHDEIQTWSFLTKILHIQNVWVRQR